MASALDSLNQLPIWQRIVMFVLGALAIAAVWFFLFYSDAVDGYEVAQRSKVAAEAELARVTTAKDAFLERRKQNAQLEADLQNKLEVLPMSSASVDNLMQTFQQQARLVGLAVESWTPAAEAREDFYARLPVKVKVQGSWPQAGEFFRRVSELDRIVSVDGLRLEDSRNNRAAPEGSTDHPLLSLEFEAATYRFLTEEERKAAQAPAGGRKGSRRRGGTPK